MNTDDIARLVVYSFVAMPALLFVLSYLWLLPRLRITTETVHLIAFTATIAYIVLDFLVAIVLGWWAFSLPRFLSVLGVAGCLLWHRYYLLMKYNVLPRIRRERRARKARRETGQRAVQQVD